MHRVILGLSGAIVAALLAACSPAASPATTPSPAPAVTVTATETVEATASAEQSVPKSCLDALDGADKGFLIASDIVGVTAEAFEAVANDDSDGVSKAVDKLNALTEKLGGVGDTYRKNREDCRDKAAGI